MGSDIEGYSRLWHSKLNKELKPQIKSSPDGVNPGPLPHIFINELDSVLTNLMLSLFLMIFTEVSVTNW
jgi:hypothetical protein